MDFARYLAAWVVGVALLCTPFVRYGAGAGHGPTGTAGHMDHGPRYGGLLFMVRDYHVELVERGAQIEVYLSDRTRRPTRPKKGHMTIDGERRPLVWKRYRLVASAPSGEHRTDYTLRPPSGPDLHFKYP